MKLTPQIVSGLCIGLSLTVCTLRAISDDVIGEWDLSRAEMANDAIVVPETDGTAGGLTSTPAAGMHVDMLDGKKAVVFDGNPPGKLASVKPITWEEGRDFRVDVDVNPAGTTGGYVVRLFCNFALEYTPPNGLTLITWCSQGVQSVSAQIGANEWSTVSAQMSKGELSLTVNGQTQNKKLPDGNVLAAARGTLWVGAPRTNADTSFAGGIAKLKLVSLQ